MSMSENILAKKIVRYIAALSYGFFAAYGFYSFFSPSNLLGIGLAITVAVIIFIPVAVGMGSWMNPDSDINENKDEEMPDVELEVVDP